MRKETAFSGLEAAIVLIAFVVVAAVFSYVMLGAGFFATQKSQEVTYSGIKQSTSNLVLDGNIYGSHQSTTTYSNTVGSLTFWLAIPEGGQAQDMNGVKFMWTKTDTDGVVTSVIPLSTGIRYVASGAGFSTATNLLSPGAKVKIIITTPYTARPTAGEKFSLEIKPKVGASTLISKSLATGYIGGEIL